MNFKLVHEDTKFIPYLAGDNDSLEHAIEQASEDVIFIDIPQDLQTKGKYVIQPRYGLELIAQLNRENMRFSDMASYITDVTPFYCPIDSAYHEECMRNHLIARRAFTYSSRENLPCSVICKDISILNVFFNYVSFTRFNEESFDAHIADSEQEFSNLFLPRIGRLQIVNPLTVDVNSVAKQIRIYTANFVNSQWNQEMLFSFIESSKILAGATYAMLQQDLLVESASVEIDRKRQILQTKIDDGSAAKDYAL